MEAMVVRRKFSAEFKSEAVKLARQTGVSISAVARDLGVHESILRRWIHDASPAAKVKQSHTDADSLAQEVSRLRKENAQLKMERDIIKKALGYFAKDPQ